METNWTLKKEIKGNALLISQNIGFIAYVRVKKSLAHLLGM